MKEIKKAKNKNQQGITLIALVVTIVVLLILAATSIAMLTGDDGIITNAQKAQVANKEGEVIDKMGLAYSALKTEAMVKMSTGIGYQPIKHIGELAEVAAKELGLENAEKAEVPEIVNDGYHVYYQDGGSTITMLYGDNKFSLKAGGKVENNLYPNLKGVISLSTTEVVYSKLPTSENDKIENNDKIPQNDDEDVNLKTFIAKYKIEQDKQTITFPIAYPKENCEIDFGDGQKVKATHLITHTYEKAGEYIVEITGECGSFDYFVYQTDRDKLTNLIQWGTVFSRICFADCENLTGEIPVPSTNTMSKIENVSRMFKNTSITGQIPEYLFYRRCKY